MLILDLLGIGFHDVEVFGLGKDFLSKSILGRCDLIAEVICFSNLEFFENADEFLRHTHFFFLSQIRTSFTVHFIHLFAYYCFFIKTTCLVKVQDF